MRPPQKTLGINRRHLPGPQTNHGENTRLWTGYQRRLLGDGFVADDPHMAKLPKLSEDDLTQIKTIKGRAGQLSREERIDFNRVAFPEVDCIGPYSRVTADLIKAMFGGDAEFNDTIFGRDAIFYSTKFTQDAWFFNATFCEAAWFIDTTFGWFASFDSALFSERTFFHDISQSSQATPRGLAAHAFNTAHQSYLAAKCMHILIGHA